MIDMFFLILCLIPIYSIIYHIKIDKKITIVSHISRLKRLSLFLTLFLFLFLGFVISDTFFAYAFFISVWSNIMIKSTAIGINDSSVIANIEKHRFIKNIPLTDIKYVVAKNFDKNLVLEFRGDGLFFIQSYEPSNEQNIFKILDKQEHIKLIRK